MSNRGEKRDTPSSLPATDERNEDDKSAKRLRLTDNTIELVERVDMDNLRLLCDNEDLIVAEERTKFNKYAEQMRQGDGQRTVTYARKAYGVGRVYADGALSLQGFSRRIRATLATDYIDIDMVNAHPKIALSMCANQGWSTPCLRHYVEKRDSVLAQIPASRGTAKMLMLAALYGGNLSNVCSEVGAPELFAKLPPFVRQYSAEMKRIANLVYNAFGKYKLAAHATHKSGTSLRSSCLSFAMQDIEHSVLMVAVDAIRSRGWEVGVLMFDGFMVYKRDGHSVSKALLNMLSQRVKQQLNLDIRFEVKPFEEPFF